MRHALGLAMLASPFVGIFAVAWWLDGFFMALGVYALAAAIIGLIAGGMYLIQ